VLIHKKHNTRFVDFIFTAITLLAFSLISAIQHPCYLKNKFV